MLTRSIFVRRLIPGNIEAYNENPAIYQGEWIDDPQTEIGEVVSEHFLPIPDPNNPGMVMMKAVLGVCWSESKIPAISYEDGSILKNITQELEDMVEEDEDDDEDGEEEESEESENSQE